MLKDRNRRISRRDVIKGAAAGVTALILAACKPKIVEVTKIVKEVVKETVIVEGTPQVIEKEVEKKVTVVVSKGPEEVKITCSGWVDTQWAVSQRANEYNASQDKVRITIIPMPSGWQTKVMSQIEKGAPAWDGHMTHHPFRVSVQWLAQGLIEPIDDFLETSKVLNIDDFWGDAIDPDLIKWDCSVKGKVVGVPLGIDTCCQGFRADLMKEAGLPHTREDFMKERSWSNIQNWAVDLREKFKDQGIWGITTWQVYHQSLGAIYQSIAKDLYYPDGLIKFDSEEMQQALKIQSEWSWSGVAPVPGFDAKAFTNGKSVLWQGQVGVNGAAQRAWGKDRVPDALPVQAEEGGTGGNQWYTTCGFVLNKAKHPQEAVDFYLWMFGPQSDLNAKRCLMYNWFPVFKSQWEKQIDPKPENQWAKDFLPQFLNAELIPRNPYYEIEQSTAKKYCELSHAKKVGIEEACNKMMDEIKDNVSKLKIEW